MLKIIKGKIVRHLESKIRENRKKARECLRRADFERSLANIMDHYEPGNDRITFREVCEKHPGAMTEYIAILRAYSDLMPPELRTVIGEAAEAVTP